MPTEKSSKKASKKDDWSKYLLPITVIGAGAVAVYYIITNIFNAGVDAYKDMWKQQYDALIKKMDAYQKSNPEGFTTAQQQNIDEEEKVLQLTTQGLANAANALYNTLTWLGVIAGASIVALGIGKAIVDKWFNKTKGQWGTAHGPSYIAIMSMADDLAIRGYPLQATNLVSSAQTMFQTLDLPFMQQTVTTLQSQLPTLVGIQLLVAQQMIASINIEMAAVPIWLTTPLPLL